MKTFTPAIILLLSVMYAVPVSGQASVSSKYIYVGYVHTQYVYYNNYESRNVAVKDYLNGISLAWGATVDLWGRKLSAPDRKAIDFTWLDFTFSPHRVRVEDRSSYNKYYWELTPSVGFSLHLPIKDNAAISPYIRGSLGLIGLTSQRYERVYVSGDDIYTDRERDYGSGWIIKGKIGLILSFGSLSFMAEYQWGKANCIDRRSQNLDDMCRVNGLRLAAGLRF